MEKRTKRVLKVAIPAAILAFIIMPLSGVFWESWTMWNFMSEDVFRNMIYSVMMLVFSIPVAVAWFTFHSEKDAELPKLPVETEKPTQKVDAQLAQSVQLPDEFPVTIEDEILEEKKPTIAPEFRGSDDGYSNEDLDAWEKKLKEEQEAKIKKKPTAKPAQPSFPIKSPTNIKTLEDAMTENLKKGLEDGSLKVVPADEDINLKDLKDNGIKVKVIQVAKEPPKKEESDNELPLD